ncbi:MAG: hypothetical protein WAN36_05410 [Calditrichia bacterium]
MYKFTVFFLILITALALTGMAQNSEEEVKEAVPLILKALNYNQTIQEKIKDDCVIAVLYNPQSTESEREMETIKKALEKNDNIKVHGKKIKVLVLPVDNTTNLEKQIIIKKINAYWVSSNLNGFSKKIRESAKYNKVITLSNDSDMVASALAVLGTQKTDSGRKLLVNMNEAENNKQDFSENMLSTAILINE